MKILFLLINYFNDEETCLFITKQLLHQSVRDLNILIVDNGSKDRAKLESFAAMHPEITLAGHGNNLGYIGGACYGLKKFLEAGNAIPELVILSNTDIEFADDHFVANLCSITEKVDFDILGPDIFSDMLHHHQNPLMDKRISIRKLRMLTFLSSSAWLHYLFLIYYYCRHHLMRRFRKQRQSSLYPHSVYGIHGAFMIFRNTFFSKGGSFDSPLNLFGEEIFISEMALEKNMNVVFEPSLKIIHHEHSTTRVFKSRQAVKQLHASYSTLLATRVERDKTGTLRQGHNA
jgi:GT2 family glycosyltransferase